ncbi:hypothetical protein MVEN_00281200 [Mycena venus]|uniref:Uncharacterized protein n=1 Tax=Mycena venus TaxID=2733690 RepID=A0A8H6Z2X4_9AGAR|nr:hypothetical protein MVEN_00281200 [Mycena venus]
MSPDEIATLQGIGIDVVHGFVAITNETILLTLYAVLVIKAGFVLLTKERRGTKVHLIILAAILTMFFTALVLWTLDLANFIMEPKITLLDNLEQPIEAKLDNAYSFVFRLAAAQAALYAYMSLLGDAIIIHRVWVIKAYHRLWVFFIPCAFLLGSFVATFLLTYCVAVTGSDIVLGTFENPAFCKNVQTVTYVMPCATTLIATILISGTAWKYRKSTAVLRNNNVMRSSASTKKTRSQAERILILLLESGLLYFLFFAIQVIDEIPSVHDWIGTQAGVSFAITMLQYCSSVIVGIYPTAIVVLANSKHTVVDGATSISTRSHTHVDNESSRRSSSTWTTPTGTKQIEIESMLDAQRDDDGVVEVGKRPEYAKAWV